MALQDLYTRSIQQVRLRMRRQRQRLAGWLQWQERNPPGTQGQRERARRLRQYAKGRLNIDTAGDL